MNVLNARRDAINHPPDWWDEKAIREAKRDAITYEGSFWIVDREVWRFDGNMAHFEATLNSWEHEGREHRLARTHPLVVATELAELMGAGDLLAERGDVLKVLAIREDGSAEVENENGQRWTADKGSFREVQ